MVFYTFTTYTNTMKRRTKWDVFVLFWVWNVFECSLRDIARSCHRPFQMENWHHHNLCMTVLYICLWALNPLIVYTLSFVTFHSLCCCFVCARFARVQIFEIFISFGFGMRTWPKQRSDIESCARMFECWNQTSKPQSYNKNKHALDETDQRINNNTAESTYGAIFAQHWCKVSTISVCDSVNIKNCMRNNWTWEKGINQILSEKGVRFKNQCDW